MSRARATALALVNWKGVFYERYSLDRHVTALEGANGAGKTTVMIAAYVVLLPDLTRLRFSNVGEGGATGGDKGIWGRLGDPARPSYSAIELELPDGERLIAGVCLERKAEPALAITPFIVSGLNLAGQLRDVFLGSDAEHDVLPDLADVRANVERAGGRMQVFASAKDYLAALFDRGVTPLRMATDEDKNKLNEMLRTSMTGGISRALTTDLRAFLLKEESGLGDTLARMRANLDACHSTRVEVGEARRLEREIAGVYEAARAMLTASLAAARADADEQSRRVVEARAACDELARRARSLEVARVDAEARQEQSVARVKRVRAAYEQAVVRVTNMTRARTLAQRIEAIGPRFAQAAETERVFRTAREVAESERAARRRDRDGARDVYERAVRGVAELQSGLAELHRNAYSYRHVTMQLEAARRALSDASLGPVDIDAAMARVQARVAVVDTERAGLDRDVRSAVVRRAEYIRARDALAAIDGPVDAARSHEQARGALARLADAEALAARDSELGADFERAAQLAARQKNARARAAELGVDVGAAAGAGAVHASLTLEDAIVRSADDDTRAEEERAVAARSLRDEAWAKADALEAAGARWREATALVARVEAATECVARSPAQLEEIRARLGEERGTLRAWVEDAKRRRDEIRREAASVEAARGGVPPELARLRDELDAELFAARFEDLDPAEAARVEAELGPLTHALVVDDPVAAARSIIGKAREAASVWFVSPGTVVSVASDAASGKDVLVADGSVVRVTRIPSRPVLGRRARERRAGDLRADAERLGADIDRAVETLGSKDALSRDVDRLLAEAAFFEGGDPAAAGAQARAAGTSADAEATAALDRAAIARRRAMQGRARVDALRALLADAFLLDVPDYAERADSLSSRMNDTARAREALRLAEGPRRTLAELVEVLRLPLPEDEDTSSARLAVLDRERQRLFEARELLEDIARHRTAFAFGDVEHALANRTALAPALEGQLTVSRDALAETERVLAEAENAWEKATEALQKAQADREAAGAQAEQARAELQAEGGVAPSEAAVAAARDEVAARAVEREAEEREERALSTEVAIARERRAEAERAAVAGRAAVAIEERTALPAVERCHEALHGAERAGFVAHGQAHAAGREERSAAALASEASSRADVLLDRLGATRGGADCAVQVRQALSARHGLLASADAYLQAWAFASEWVKAQLPAQLGTLPDPLGALDRLRADLTALEGRLARQESDLRVASEDVALGIDVQVRRARHQVRRLDRSLEGIGFGSIGGIRVQMRPVERMEQVLRALREGAAQELLFQPSLPIEEALDEIFRRYGGGRGGGHRILDYREYVDLVVEVRRRAEGAAWEVASPARLSTGEAIGVGAALMMVILTEWERDSNLLRAKRGAGSLRFLFLDEANRLSQDSLGVLFDLCKTLDLQLLVAAPEVARAEGNTTYHLVRRVTAEGREEVLVSGRRMVANA
jgi:chromosome partition protein MukB